VVNADAMQVYAELSILTARPTPAEAATVPHRLYGHVPAREAYSVARWLADVAPVLAEAAAAGRVPIVVGGTGLYFEALTRGLAPVPEIPEAVREGLRREAVQLGPVGLHARLARRDPAMAARLRDSDPQRILRALEVIEATGRSLDDWQRTVSTPLLDPAEAVRVVLAPDRAWLHARIEERVGRMIEAGALDEAAAFARLDLDPALPASRAIGVQAFAAAARGDIAPNQALGRAVVDTRRYARRQETWFRNRMADWWRFDPRNIREAAAAILKDPALPA